jgi:hypothetical protein
MLGTLDDVALSEADVRSLSTRVSPPAALGTAMLKLESDLDFVVGEWRMALDYDPDATHFLRAGRAEKTTADELASFLAELPAR